MIFETNKFNEYWNALDKVFFLEKNFPEDVFKIPFSHYGFIEFDESMTSRFWDEIRTWSSEKTKEIIMAVIDPDPVGYYYRVFQRYNMIVLPKEAQYSQYSEALDEEPPNSPADSIFTNSTVIGWIPDSLEWAIWGDRGHEFCVIGSNSKIQIKYTDLDLMEIEDALNIMQAYHRKLDSSFFETFRANYGEPRKN
ncbi:hypothetical protein [Leptospira noguchii]|uniref:hypothetical protein n=1 Tax=Leptospira noguchii TaxID=28182 RepID=UPI001146D2F7|nr:hypothetical protein [Leptospira noguchii]TQE68566.1 hypothetical protein FF021_16690 [Leptospira noguchii]UOG51390.1 hypothetical protein MAL09_11800 [Leptospira noguchii]